jgi:hypothetical protein
MPKRLYHAAPVLIREAVINESGEVVQPEVNPWGIRFQAMFHMSADSDLFADSPAAMGQPPRLPLYEAKMIHQFDHRWATYVDAAAAAAGEVETADLSEAQKADPAFNVRPRYWMDQREVLARIARVPARVSRAWLRLHAAQDSAEREAVDAALTDQLLALAQWVAGELFHRTVGAPLLASGWTPSHAQPHIAPTESQLRARFPKLSEVLRGDGMTMKKALAEFPKWAMQNADARLDDDELTALAEALLTATVASALIEVLDGWMDRRSPRWLIGWRDITGTEKVRTLISSVVPRSGVGDKFLLIHSMMRAELVAALLGNLNALTCDFVARQKVGGTSFKYFTMKQIAVLPPDGYSSTALDFIVPRVLELTYTSYDLKSWADDLAAYDPRGAAEREQPFAWNPRRRAQLRAELDAYYAGLYGLTRDELRYILDPKEVMGEDYPSETFRVLKEGEIRSLGEYRTRRLVLEAWDRLIQGELSQSSNLQQAAQYSAQAMIRNDDEAWLAGLVAALLTSTAEGCTVDELQNLVARSQAGDQLDESEARLLASNVDSAQLVSARSLLDRIRPIVERLEGCSAVSRRVAGAASRFTRTDVALPIDVVQTPGQAEIAGLLHLAENRRLERAAGVEATSESQLPVNRGVG